MNPLNANVVEYAPANYEVAPEALPETAVTESETPKKKNVAARIFAPLFSVATVLVALLLNVKVALEANVINGTLYKAIASLFKGGVAKAFGLPVLTNAINMSQKVAGLALYGVLALLAVSAVLGIVTIFCSKKAPAMLRATVYLFTVGFALNAANAFMFRYYIADKVLLDLVSIACAAVGALVYFVLAIAKNGKKAWLYALQFVLSLAAVGAAVWCATHYTADFINGVSKGLKGVVKYKYVFIAILGVSAFTLLVGSIRMQTKKGLALDLIRYILQFIIGVAVCYIAIMSKAASKLFLVFAIVAAAVSLLQMILCVLQMKGKKEKKAKAEKKAKKEKKAKQPAKEEVVAPAPAPMPAPMPMPAPAPVMATVAAPAPVAAPAAPVAPAAAPAPVMEATSEYIVEEYAEALPYDGGPVEGVALAQEVNPTYVAPTPAPVQTAGYDFYNSKSFDPFIAVLNDKERNEFTELFIVKYRGLMPEIPDYTVGGDNKEFFRKLFIYLGQYRDRIPDGLLAKIYQYTVKMQ